MPGLTATGFAQQALAAQNSQVHKKSPPSPKDGMCKFEPESYERDVGTLDAERLLDYANTWRGLANQWTAMAGTARDPHSSKLRRTAQAALHAACLAEELLKAHIADQAARQERPARVTDVITVTAPTSAPEKRRHGPLPYGWLLEPVAAA
jgi:hypothetical protein